MADKNQAAPKKIEKLQESVNGVNKLSPAELEIGKSLNGISNLAPQNLQSSTAPDPAKTPSAAPKVQDESTGKDKK